MSQRLPTLFIPHGGGPCFFMEPMRGLPADTWDSTAAYLRGIDAALGVRPKAVLVISGHWEEARPTLNVAAAPPLLFDYYGFPEHTYRLQYPAPGAPALAAEVAALLHAAGFETGTDSERGLDHGVFVPFLLIYPKADVPILQLSLQSDLDPAQHLAIGRALAPLRDQGVLIVGSGNSYHNLRQFFDPRGIAPAERFDAWLTATVTDPDPAARDRGLSAWDTAPGALECHPRAEHLLPLMVAAGAAGADRGQLAFHTHIAGKANSGYQFG